MKNLINIYSKLIYNYVDMAVKKPDIFLLIVLIKSALFLVLMFLFV